MWVFPFLQPPVPDTSLSLNVGLIGGVAFGLALLAVLGRPLRGTENTESTRRRLLFLGVAPRPLRGRREEASPGAAVRRGRVEGAILPWTTRD